MLTPSKRLLVLVWASTLFLASALSLPAHAAPTVSCPEGTVFDGSSCQIRLDSPSNDGGSTALSAREPNRCYRAKSGAQVEIPCASEGGWWSASRECYMLYVPNPSDPSIPPGETNGETGGVYECINPFASSAYTVWIPQSDIPTFVDAARMAAQLIASMDFEPVRIGSTPDTRELSARSVGLVGLPTWLWVMDPGPTTWGPNTKSVTLNGVTVTATGRVDQIVWSMGNGDSVTCTGPGTAYADSDDASPSPDCGYRHQETGTFDVTARAAWTVSWTASTGESGTVPLSVASVGRIVMGEAQVINR